MANAIPDATSFLADLVTQFQNDVSQAVSQVKIDLESSLEYAQRQLDLVGPQVQDYIDANPVTLVAYDKRFISTMNWAKTNMQRVATNLLNQASIAFGSVKTNANLDYTRAIDAAYSKFNDSLRAVNITDADYQTKLTASTDQMSDIVSLANAQVSGSLDPDGNPYLDAMNNVITGSFNDYQDKFTAAYQQALNDSNSKITDFINNRAVIVFTGKAKIPKISNYNASYDFSFELKNAGNQPFTGHVGVRLSDIYHKHVDSVPGPTSFSLSPGDTREFQASVYIPKATKDSKGRMLNMGKSLSATITFIPI